ncbi:MAG: hypothetical protein JXA73_10855 [Acidobacteria bacterium]|nr:hypothetical protein [Acidobacteriota bacterium]
MDKKSFQDVMWLFQELGRHLRPKIQDAPDNCDTRILIWHLAQGRHSTVFDGRNPYNWIKELQSVSNLWHHLSVESDIPDDDVWRDLDTMERVARYLDLDSKFIEELHGVKMQIWAEKNIENDNPALNRLRLWISEEISRQLKVINMPQGSRVAEAGEPLTEYGSSISLESHRGEIADHVRDYVIATYIEPARSGGQKKVSVRAGDVDKALGYRYRRLPLICAALRSNKFLESGRIKLLDITGPPSGASTTTTFTFELE